MRSGLLLLLALVACGDDAVDPGDASAADLHGVWVKPLAQSNQFRVFSFRASGNFHPMLAGQTDVFAIYDVSDAVQIPRIMGTYRVENGVIVQTPVWVEEQGTLTNAAELRNDLLSLTKGQKLAIEGGDGMPSMYDHADECVVPATADGWRAHLTRTGTWVGTPTSGTFSTSASYGTSNVLTSTMVGLVTQYDGDCIPTVTNDNVPGNAWVAPTAGGTHVITGRGAATAAYAKLAAGPLALTPRTLPVPGTEIVDATDLDGSIGILVKPAAGGLVVVRDDGAGFTQTPVTNLPPQFAAAQIVHAGGGRALIVGSGFASGNQRMFVVEETSPGVFASTQVPFETFSSYYAAAGEAGDLWIVYAATLDPGGGRPRTLHLATRRGGTWTTRAIGMGVLPELIVKNGVAHVTNIAVTMGTLLATLYYTRVDGNDVKAWMVPPHEGASTGATSGIGGIQNPSVAVAADGTLAIGFLGAYYVRRPGDTDTRKIPMTVTITGAGRVTSADGLVDCTQTCSLMVEVGRRVLVHAVPQNAGMPSINCGGTFDQTDPSYCASDILHALSTATVSVQFP